MNDCATTWRRYLSLMDASRRTQSARHRKQLIHDAYMWLEGHFQAVERELKRNNRIAR
jgi:hypothetical protein